MKGYFIAVVFLALVCAIDGRGYYWENLKDWRSTTTTSTTTTTPAPTPAVSYRRSYFRSTYPYQAENTYRKSWSPPSSRASWRTASSSSSSSSSPSSSQPSSSGPIIYWEPRCRFPRDYCGIENQEMMGSTFQPGYTYIGSSYEKVMILDTQLAASSAARLITPYIKAKNWDDICLTMEYMIQDEGVEKLTVIQQDRQDTRPIYQVEGENKKGKWRMAKMDIVLREGIVRYFVEGRFKPGKRGIIMIRSLDYEVGRCADSDDSRQQNASMRRSRLMDKYWQLTGE